MITKKQFQGSLETMPLSNILQWLADSKKTGTLVITISDEEKRILFKDGIIVSASSNLEKERFGIIIIKKGYLTQEQVDELLEEGRQTGKLLGKLCAEKGHIPEDEVKNILIEQSVAIVESLLHRTEGQFVFLDDTLDGLDQIPLSIALQELFFGSAGKRKEWQRIYDLLGSLEAIPKIPGTQPGNIQSLSEFQQSLFSRCDGKRRILDLLAEIDQKDFVICQALADLVEKKWLVIENPSEEMQREYQDRMWQVHISLEQKRFLRASMLLDEVETLFPDRLGDVKALRDKTNRFLEADMQDLLSDESLVLLQKKEFDPQKASGRKFGPEEWFIFSRIDGVTSLKDLIRMTGLSKDQSKRAIYALLDVDAIDIKGKKKSKDIDSGSKEQTSVSDSKNSSRSTQDRRKKNLEAERTAEDETSSGKPLDVAELDRTYRKYLKMNHYQILNVSRESSPDEVRSSFVKLSRLYHPDMYDRGNLDPDVEDRLEELFSMVNHAYRVVSNTKSKNRYDKQLWVDGRSTSTTIIDLEDRVSHIDEIVLKPKKEKSPRDKSPPKTAVKTDSASSESQQTSEKLKKVGADKERIEMSASTSSQADESEEQKFLTAAIELFKENKHREAVEKLESVIKLNARNPEAYYYLSRSQQRLGGKELSEALNNIKRALILDKENTRYFCQIARVYASMEMTEDAERYLKTALAWDSENREAKYLLEKLKEGRQTGFFARFKKKKKN